MAKTKPTNRDPNPKIPIALQGVVMADAAVDKAQIAATAVAEAFKGNTTVIDKADAVTAAAKITAKAARITHVAAKNNANLQPRATSAVDKADIAVTTATDAAFATTREAAFVHATNTAVAKAVDAANTTVTAAKNTLIALRKVL